MLSSFATSTKTGSHWRNMKCKYVRQVLITQVLVLTGVNIALVGPPTAGEPETEELCNRPQFLGQRRENVSDDMGLLKRWPDGGPELIWKTAKIGHGFASVAIVDGMIYTAGNMEDITVITAPQLLLPSPRVGIITGPSEYGTFW